MNLTPEQTERFKRLRKFIEDQRTDTFSNVMSGVLQLVNECEAEAVILNDYREAHKGLAEAVDKPCRNPACRNRVKDVAFCNDVCREVFHAMRLPPPGGMSIERLQELYPETDIEVLTQWQRYVGRTHRAGQPEPVPAVVTDKLQGIVRPLRPCDPDDPDDDVDEAVDPFITTITDLEED